MLDELKKMMGEEPVNNKVNNPVNSQAKKVKNQGTNLGEGGSGGTTDKENDPLSDGGGDGGERKLKKKAGLSSDQLRTNTENSLMPTKRLPASVVRFARPHD